MCVCKCACAGVRSVLCMEMNDLDVHKWSIPCAINSHYVCIEVTSNSHWMCYQRPTIHLAFASILHSTWINYSLVVHFCCIKIVLTLHLICITCALLCVSWFEKTRAQIRLSMGIQLALSQKIVHITETCIELERNLHQICITCA